VPLVDHRATVPDDRFEAKMKRAGSVLPEGEGLRRAVAWLAEQPRRDAATIEEASRRFNLSPLEEDFLLREFRAPGRRDG
jgi:hypothetical protein